MKWFVFRVIKLVRRFCMRSWRRIVSLAFVSALLLSCVSVGVTNVQKAKAIAVADDFAILAEGLKVIVTYACSAAGASNSDIVTTTSSEGITDYKGAKQYVHDTFSGDSFFGKIFKYDPATMLKVEAKIASAAMAGGRILRKSFLKKVWSQYDPRTDGWDKEKWGELTDEEQRAILFNWEEWIEKFNMSATMVPNPPYDHGDDDDDDDSEDFDETGQYKPKGNSEPFVLDEKVLGAVPSMASFKVIYTLTKFLNEDDTEKQYEKDNYSWQWWKDSTMESNNGYDISPFLHVGSDTKFYDGKDGSGKPFDGKDYYVGFSNDFLDWNYGASKFFPIEFLDNGVPKFRIATNHNGRIYDEPVYGGYFIGNDFNPKGLTEYDTFDWCFGLTGLYNNLYVKNWNDNFVNNAVKNYTTLPSGTVCDMPWVLKCKDKNDADKVVSMIKTGNFSKDDIMPYLVDGWKSNRKKSWKAIDDKGATSKKIVESGKADKYMTKGTKVKKDGTKESGSKGVTWGSLVDGMAVIGDSSSSAVGVGTLLGGQTELNDNISYPSANDYPDGSFDSKDDIGTNPGTGTDPGTGKDPGTGTDPGTGKDPGGDSGDDLTMDFGEYQWYERFPFCIPWDIYDGVSMLNAKTKEPIFDMPFKIERLGIDEVIHVDLTDYDVLGVICRWFLRLMYILGLAILSRNIIRG